jgi:hypothetical protein
MKNRSDTIPKTLGLLEMTLIITLILQLQLERFLTISLTIELAKIALIPVS